jgi:hypothetical protein
LNHLGKRRGRRRGFSTVAEIETQVYVAEILKELQRDDTLRIQIKKWEKPSSGLTKINRDASFQEKSEICRMGLCV